MNENCTIDEILIMKKKKLGTTLASYVLFSAMIANFTASINYQRKHFIV